MSLIGKGSFGSLYRYNDKIAYKELPVTTQSRGEVRILQKLALCDQIDRYATKYVSSFIKGDKLYLLISYLSGDSLKKYVAQNITFSLGRRIIEHLIVGLNYLHDNGVVHRDIKPDNIVFDNNLPKYVDFGSARFLSDLPGLYRMSGTPYYQSPEFLNLRELQQKLNDMVKYGYRSSPHDYQELLTESKKDLALKSITNDLWALGVTFYQLINDHLPFNSRRLETLNQEIKDREIHSTSPYPLLNEVVQEMLVKDYRERLTGKEILEHFLKV